MRAVAISLMCLVFVALAQAQPSEIFAPKGWGCSIRFPGIPKESKQAVKKTKLGDVRIDFASVATVDGHAFAVTVGEYPPGALKPENAGVYLEGVREGLKGKDGKVLEETAIEFGANKLPGRDMLVERGKTVHRVRAVIRDDRIYQASAVGPPAFAASEEAKKFVDSFEITK